MKKKLDRREAVRERKALSAARLERSIEAELIERLKSKAYGDAPLNVNESVWQAVLDRERNAEKSKGKELEMEDEESEEEEEEELEEEDGWGEREFVSDMSGDEDDDMEDNGLSDMEGVSGEDESGEDDEGSDGESGEDNEGGQKKTALGKRKTAPPTKKPPRKGPEKKARRESSLSRLVIFQLLISQLSQADREWRWSTSTRWRVSHLRRRHWPVGNTIDIFTFTYVLCYRTPASISTYIGPIKRFIP